MKNLGAKKRKLDQSLEKKIKLKKVKLKKLKVSFCSVFYIYENPDVFEMFIFNNILDKENEVENASTKKQSEEERKATLLAQASTYAKEVQKGVTHFHSVKCIREKQNLFFCSNIYTAPFFFKDSEMEFWLSPVRQEPVKQEPVKQEPIRQESVKNFCDCQSPEVCLLF